MAEPISPRQQNDVKIKNDNNVSIKSVIDMENLNDVRELSSEIVLSISSAKPGNGVEQLRDGSLDTYWQSDGAAPHLVNIQFLKKSSVSHLCFYCDFSLDESYTPKRVNLRSGTCIHDLIDITTIELNDAKGWVILSLSDNNKEGEPLRTHMLQLRILSMHQNGRDTHIRQLKILGPRSTPYVMANTKLDNFKTEEMLQFAQLR